MRPLFDTNILIDLTEGVHAATQELDSYPFPAISIITWMEVLAGAEGVTEAKTRRLLSQFEIIQLSDAISEEAVIIRRRRRMKLPDAIIWATARLTGRVLITRDVKDFPLDDPGIRIPYRLG